MPFDIIPAIAITKLDLRISKFGDAAAHSQLYQYMVKKYTNLIDIEYQDDGLEHYDINDRKQIYSDGILDFLKLIGPKKNKLHLNDLLDSVDVFEALDEVDAKIKELHFRMCHGSATFEHLCRSNLIHHIETLRIVNTRLDSIQHLKSMSVLTRLTIFNIPPIYLPIPLIECLAGCPPTVKYLHIESNDLIIKPYKTRLNSIESLSIGFKTLSSDLGDIISFCFPNLVKLKLTGEVTESLHITLQSPHLQEAVFSTSGAVMADYCKHGFSFKSLNQTAYYICNGEHKYMTRRGKKRVEYNELKDLPTLSVEYVKDATLKVYSDIKVIPC
ncbi:hypothetical protein K501DRAFT_287204 [Backusella circina FSU 941]|nr:hypothetical protein K501DRAFT_287204 [Backusella circina FSU 941]